LPLHCVDIVSRTNWKSSSSICVDQVDVPCGCCRLVAGDVANAQVAGILQMACMKFDGCRSSWISLLHSSVIVKTSYRLLISLIVKSVTDVFLYLFSGTLSDFNMGMFSVN
jgi:hypothetical protein